MAVLVYDLVRLASGELQNGLHESVHFILLSIFAQYAMYIQHIKQNLTPTVNSVVYTVFAVFKPITISYLLALAVG